MAGCYVERVRDDDGNGRTELSVGVNHWKPTPHKLSTHFIFSIISYF